jgi:hypothetical protein
MFTVTCAADDEPFEMAFIPSGEPVEEADWTSTDGTIIIRRSAVGWYHAYQAGSHTPLSEDGHPDKETAAHEACKAWVN